MRIIIKVSTGIDQDNARVRKSNRIHLQFIGGKSKPSIAMAPVLAFPITCARTARRRKMMVIEIPLSCALWKNEAPKMEKEEMDKPVRMWKTINR